MRFLSALGQIPPVTLSRIWGLKPWDQKRWGFSSKKIETTWTNRDFSDILVSAHDHKDLLTCEQCKSHLLLALEDCLSGSEVLRRNRLFYEKLEFKRWSAFLPWTLLSVATKAQITISSLGDSALWVWIMSESKISHKVDWSSPPKCLRAICVQTAL